MNLTRPLVVFDLESTGLEIATDSIIQVAYVKVMTDGTESRDSILINPCKPISKQITELTGISDADVADKPTFKDLSSDLLDIFSGCDLAGFNSNHFDVPLLVEEFLRAGKCLDLSQVNLIDARAIFCKMEQRNLSAAYEFYCGRKMDDDFRAHRADQDAEATYRVLKGELEMYSDKHQTDTERILPQTFNEIAKLTNNNNNIDFAGRFVMTDGVPTFNFGKYKGKPMADILLYRDRNYYFWMMESNFSLDTKQWLQRIYMQLKK